MVDDPENLNAPTRRDEVEGEGAIRGTARMEAFADGALVAWLLVPPETPRYITEAPIIEGES